MTFDTAVTEISYIINVTNGQSAQFKRHRHLSKRCFSVLSASHQYPYTQTSLNHILCLFLQDFVNMKVTQLLANPF